MGRINTGDGGRTVWIIFDFGLKAASELFVQPHIGNDNVHCTADHMVISWEGCVLASFEAAWQRRTVEALLERSGINMDFGEGVWCREGAETEENNEEEDEARHLGLFMRPFRSS
jgi:hypothetical protein